MDIVEHVPDLGTTDDIRRDALIVALQRGLPLVPSPYAALAAQLGSTESAVISQIRALRENGTIRRFGVVVRHRALGYRANAMVVWDIPDTKVSVIGRRLGSVDFVTLCYRRPRRLPAWPYNLFCMIHGRDRSTVLSQVERITERFALQHYNRAVLFSRRCFKQRGARYVEAS